jgi:hypothetical protein
VVVGALAGPARGQDADPLRIQGFVPDGARSTATEAWGTFEFTVLNTGPTARDARVAVVYAARPDVHYARDVWVPPHASLTTWVAVGPAPDQATPHSRDIRMLLYDRTGVGLRTVLPPGEERDRTRPVPYRKRAPTVAVLADPDRVDAALGGPTPESDAVLWARVVRNTIGLSEHVGVVRRGPLPPLAEGFDGTDVLMLAGRRVATDPPGRAAIRRWVQHGGILWVPLDLVSPDDVAPILGDDFDIATVDRVGLTTLQLHARGENPAMIATREVEQPVDLVRVVPAASDRVVHVVNGWPASFVRTVGRGRVVFTALGARGWFRPRERRDPPSSYRGIPDLPVGLRYALELAGELHPQAERDPVPPDALGPLLAGDIGYAVVGRPTAAAVLGGFALALAGLWVVLRRSRRPELVGWLAPAAAVAAAGTFVVLGERSRHAVPPTTAAAEVVLPVPGSGEAAVTGLYAVYHPESGPVTVGTRDGATLDFDQAGLDGQIRRRIQTDTDAWAWDRLALPAGVRTGPYQATRAVGRVAAVGRFGPGGFEGRFLGGSYSAPADAVIVTPAGEPVGVAFGADGAFTAHPLPAGQHLTGAVLDDRQQRRQAVYRQLLGGPLPRHLQDRNLFLTWADPPGVPFTGTGEGRVVGTALVAAPLEFEPSPPGTSVVIPRGFLPYRRIVEGRPNPPILQGEAVGTDMRLRFQLPASVLPLRVERATLFARVRAPYRKVSVAGVADGKPVPVFEAVAPAEAIRVEIADERLLRTDPAGGLLLNFTIGEPTGDATGSQAWVIESLALEVAGRTGK